MLADLQHVTVLHFDDQLSDVIAFVIPDSDINHDPDFDKWENDTRAEIGRLVKQMDRNNLMALLEVCKSMQAPLIYLD